MMKKKMSFCIFVVLFCAFGCGSQRTFLIQPPKEPLGKYDSIEISDFTCHQSLGVPQKVLVEMPDELAARFKEEKLFQNVSRISITPNPGNVLVLRGEIIQYNPGDRGARWFWGGIGNAGEGSITVRVILVDKSSGKELCEANMESRISSGFFGGSIEYTYDRVVEEITNFCKTHS